MLFGLFILSNVVRRYRAKKAEGRLRLPGSEVSDKLPNTCFAFASSKTRDYGAIAPRERGYAWDLVNENLTVERACTPTPYRTDSPARFFFP